MKLTSSVLVVAAGKPKKHGKYVKKDIVWN